MTLQDWAALSNLAFATATVVYALAMLAHAAEWATLRRTAAEPATAAVHGGAVTQVAERASRPWTENFGRIGVSLTVLAFSVHLVGVLARGLAAERVPWGNMFEFSTTGALAVAGAYLTVMRWQPVRWLGLLVTGFVLVVLGLAMLVPSLYVPPGPLVPALHSYWLVIHVAAACIAGGAFTVGALASIVYLFKSRPEKTSAHPESAEHRALVPPAQRIDRLAYQLHAFALPVWTFAVLAGAIWAEYAWGRYWGWDPKETWAFITWVVYAAYLHARATAGWRGRAAAVLALIGFATFLFNFIGINLFASGLHSYAGTG